MANKFEISRVVISQAKKLGFDEPVLPKLKKMLINSDHKSKEGSIEGRVFEEYEFVIHNGVVCVFRKAKKVKTFMTPHYYKCEDCKDSRKISVFEDCMHCEDEAVQGSKCQYCFGKGGLAKLIPCQTCSQRNKNYKN